MIGNQLKNEGVYQLFRALEANEALSELPEVTGLIERTIVDEPPMTVKEGGIIREGYNEHLDELRGTRMKWH